MGDPQSPPWKLSGTMGVTYQVPVVGGHAGTTILPLFSQDKVGIWDGWDLGHPKDADADLDRNQLLR